MALTANQKRYQREKKRVGIKGMRAKWRAEGAARNSGRKSKIAAITALLEEASKLAIDIDTAQVT